MYCKMITTISLVNIHHSNLFSCDKIKIYSLGNFKIYNTVLLTILSMLCIPRTCLSYNWKFVSFEHFHTFFFSVFKSGLFVGEVRIRKLEYNSSD